MHRHTYFSASSLVLIVLSGAIFLGCGKKDSSYEEPTAAANPFAAYAGDWMTEVYTAASDEPAVVVLIKGTDSAEGWTMKFVNVDEPVGLQVSVVGDSLVTRSASYPSALREGRTVTSVTSYLAVNGDQMSGRFHAAYDDGETRTGRMVSERVK